MEASKIDYLMMDSFSKYIQNKYDCFVMRSRFNYEYCAGNYKYLLSKEMRNEFNKQSVSRKLYILLCVIFPFFDFLLTKRIKNRKVYS